MEQVLINTPATIRETWYEDGIAADPGTVTVTVTRSDGTVLVTNASTTPVAAFTGDIDLKARAYSLPTAQTGRLDQLTLTWLSTTHGALTSRVEVVGGFYFSIAEWRARYPDDDVSADVIAAARATAEDIIEGLETEDGCHQAFVPRAETFKLSGDGTTRLSIPRYRLRSVDSCKAGGVTVDPATLSIEASSVYARRWTRGFTNVEITVAHGMDAPPRRIKDAAILLTYHLAIKGPIDDRATAIPTDGGVIQLATPGRAGYITGIPEVDAAIAQYQLPRIAPISISLGERGREYPPLQVL